MADDTMRIRTGNIGVRMMRNRANNWILRAYDGIREPAARTEMPVSNVSHHMWQLLFDGKLYHAPISQSPQVLMVSSVES